MSNKPYKPTKEELEEANRILGLKNKKTKIPTDISEKLKRFADYQNTPDKKCPECGTENVTQEIIGHGPGTAIFEYGCGCRHVIDDNN